MFDAKVISTKKLKSCWAGEEIRLGSLTIPAPPPEPPFGDPFRKVGGNFSLIISIFLFSTSVELPAKTRCTKHLKRTFLRFGLICVVQLSEGLKIWMGKLESRR